MQTILVFVELVVAAALIIFVLLQRSEGGALGMGGGGMGGLFSPRGAADTLTRTTSILAGLFFLVCMALNILALHGRDERSILESPVTTSGAINPAKPAAPVVPAGPQVPKPQ